MLCVNLEIKASFIQRMQISFIYEITTMLALTNWLNHQGDFKLKLLISKDRAVLFAEEN